MTGHVLVTPGIIPRSGRLVAKTCVGCGELKQADQFWRNGKPGRHRLCNQCGKFYEYRKGSRRERLRARLGTTGG